MTPRTWQLQEAKAKFSELVDLASREGPQVVTRRGAEAVAIVPIDLWRSLQPPPKSSLKSLLLAAEPRSATFHRNLPKRTRQPNPRVPDFS